MSLDKIFGLYTIGFLGVTILIGIGEAAGLFSNQMIGWIFMALSLLIYVFIGILTRTSNPDQYYVAGRGVPAVYNGMATGSDWMSAASFISMGGALSAQGFAGLAYVMGWTGGYLLLAVFLGPYLRQFGAYTIPDFLGARYGGNAARIIGVIAAIACSFTYLIAQVTGVGPHRRPVPRARLQHRRLRRPARRAVLLGPRRDALGDLDPGRAVHHPDHFLPRPRRVPVVDDLLDPDPRADLRPAPPAEQHARARDHPRRQGEGDARALEEGRRRRQRQDQGRRPPRGRGRQAQGPGRPGHAAGDGAGRERDAKFGRYLTVPEGVGHVELPRPHVLPHGGHGGAAPHPHALLHDALGAPGAHVGGVVALLHLPPVLHRPRLRRLRAVRDLREAGRHQDRRAAALGDAVEARRPLRRGRQERGRHRPVGGLRGEVHRLRRARRCPRSPGCPS